MCALPCLDLSFLLPARIDCLWCAANRSAIGLERQRDKKKIVDRKSTRTFDILAMHRKIRTGHQRLVYERLCSRSSTTVGCEVRASAYAASALNPFTIWNRLLCDITTHNCLWPAIGMKRMHSDHQHWFVNSFFFFCCFFPFFSSHIHKMCFEADACGEHQNCPQIPYHNFFSLCSYQKGSINSMTAFNKIGTPKTDVILLPSHC